MIDITDRVRVEAGYARKRAVATLEHLLATGYARRATEVATAKGWRLTPDKKFMVRTFDAQGIPIIVDQPYQYLTKEGVWYIYVLTAVRHPRTGEVHPRYMPIDHRPDEASARARAEEVAADLDPILDVNGDGVIDFHDMPVVEVA